MTDTSTNAPGDEYIPSPLLYGRTSIYRNDLYDEHNLRPRLAADTLEQP